MEMLPFSIGPSRGPESRCAIDAILRAVREHLGMEASFVAQFSDGRRVFRNIQTASGFRFASVGDWDPLEDSYCHWIAKGKLPQLIRDSSDHPFTERLAATKALPVGAHLSVPIVLDDGSTYGTFCCFSRTPDRSLTTRDLAVMRAFAELAGQQIHERMRRERHHDLVRARIGAILQDGRIEMVFQPALRIDRPQIAFVEALARFPDDDPSSPAEWFEAAHEVGLGIELELLAFDSAIGQLGNLPDSAALSINVSPETVLSGGLRRRLQEAPAERLILEVTELRPIADYAEVALALGCFREKGLRLAVDDAGTGHTSLRHILHLQPDVIKLNISLSRGIDCDPVRRALTTAMIEFARSIGGELVAEGVESPTELAALRNLGVTIVQGHLCARPGPLEDLAIDSLAA